PARTPGTPPVSPSRRRGSCETAHGSAEAAHWREARIGVGAGVSDRRSAGEQPPAAEFARRDPVSRLEHLREVARVRESPALRDLEHRKSGLRRVAEIEPAVLEPARPDVPGD